jgi:hypothetical protein
MLAAINRCGSLVEFSLITVNATWPGRISLSPSLREINLQFGGNIELTRTMLQAAIPAFLSASSKLESLSRCFPTPFVRKIFLATNAIVPGHHPDEYFHANTLSPVGKVTSKFPSVNADYARIRRLVSLRENGFAAGGAIPC